MDADTLLALLSRWVHIGTAIVVIGGSVFMRFVLMPAAEQLPDNEHEALRERVLGRWKRFVHLGVLLFLLSGGYNYILAVRIHKGQSLYHALVGTKIILALIVFFLASAIVGRSPTFENLRKNMKRWVLVVILLATVIVGISGFVKVTIPPAAGVPSTTTGDAAQ